MLLAPMVDIVGMGTHRDPAAIQLATKAGTYIENARRRPQHPSVMAAAVKMHAAAHGTLTVRSLSSEYNCVGMVFASRRTCVDVEHVSLILGEDGYRQVPPRDVARGDVLVYRNPQNKEVAHIGLVYQHSPDVEHADWQTLILSQWGADGEYFHAAADVHPGLGVPTEFWSERRR